MSEEKQEEPMPRYKCTQCDRSFKLPQGLGRHMSTTHSNKTVTKGASLNGYKIKIENFEDATRELIATMRALVSEANLYRKERDELASFTEKLRLFISTKEK